MNNREEEDAARQVFHDSKKKRRGGERERKLQFRFYVLPSLVKVAKNYYFTTDTFQNTIHISIKTSLHFFLEQCVTDLPKNIARFQFDLSTEHFRNIIWESRNLANCAVSFSLLATRWLADDTRYKALGQTKHLCNIIIENYMM